MRKLCRWTVIAALAGLAWLAISASHGTCALAAEPPADDVTQDIGVSHAGCSFFGGQRQDFLRVGLGADLMAMKRAELTTKLSGALAASSLAPRSRARALDSLVQSYGSGQSIDDFILGQLKIHGIPPAPRTTDSEFLRRVSLDLTGRIPTPNEVVQFLSDPDPGKRSGKIAALLDTPQWADRWAMFFGDLYRNTRVTAQVNRYVDGRDAFHVFLLDSLRQNKPYDQMVREILAATGAADGRTYPAEYATYEQFQQVTNDYEGNPVKPTAASYIVGGLTTGGPIQDTYDALAAVTARDFLGISHMDCILCHDGKGHLDSLSVWGAATKRADGWGLASFFSKTTLTRPRRLPAAPEGQPPLRPRYWIVADNSRGTYRLNTTTGNRPARQPAAGSDTEVADPVYPFGGGKPLAGEPYTQALGRLLTADKQFARAAVNYVWRQFFGRGIVEPPDQFDLARLDPASPPPDPWTIQPSHPELLEFLAAQFVEHRFDLKWLMSEIANSDAYQLSSRYDGVWSPSYETYFARHQVRRLTAEEIHDALVISGGLPAQYAVSPTIGAVSLAMQFPDVQMVPRVVRRDPTGLQAAAPSFLDSFFRGDREETPRSGDGSILQALQLMNSPLVLARVDAHNPATALAQIVLQADDVAVQLLYLRVLSRPPAPEELASGVETLRGGDRAAKVEDLMWSLYNKIDFIFNY
jgi:Protein of unknown function (DUF1553)/Protein of unknown function (DUF1549)